MLDKIKGGLFGVAIGDALGATTEFMSRDEVKEKYGTLTEIIGGGYWDVLPGETTDDTAMTIAVAKGIIANSQNHIEEIGKEFLKWSKTNPKDIGITIRNVLENYEGDWFQSAQNTHQFLGGKSAGNGSLMRCLPIALAYSDKKKIKKLSILHSKMTHYDESAAVACVIYNNIARQILKGEDIKTAILSETNNTIYESSFDKQPDCPPDGYVVHTMKWVLYWLMNSKTFEEVVVGAINMGEDSDTIAAIAGGLKGMEVGFNSLPRRYVNQLIDRELLTQLSIILNEIRE
ncbi:ADP-ribosylglycohydrolase family protein [Bacillus sp. V5-8f]|uniref:ADP-ribosylglycohydrolase family protein n=1 Tax=Bacillus sp. V5-8f TaxID=2053044 RepID=UPI000C7756BA|nr:ADP-ribosylglycohydrolase family protein [Bacillus sp. V5-8f]PLT31982.1 ADP-ribosyl-[dinitrogen reductase] hydrolase [Bacillus sp. V5-8f]